MTYRGTVQGGVILIADGLQLPEGAEVRIIVADATAPTADSSDPPTSGQKLAALARKFESEPCDRPEDLAINHDHYLHGLPKRP